MLSDQHLSGVAHDLFQCRHELTQFEIVNAFPQRLMARKADLVQCGEYLAPLACQSEFDRAPIAWLTRYEAKFDQLGYRAAELSFVELRKLDEFCVCHRTLVPESRDDAPPDRGKPEFRFIDGIAGPLEQMRKDKNWWRNSREFQLRFCVRFRHVNLSNIPELMDSRRFFKRSWALRREDIPFGSVSDACV